jgi:FtsZ-interacting cell division protein ZipA
MKTIIVIVALIALLFAGAYKIRSRQKEEAQDLGTYDVPEDVDEMFEESPYVALPAEVEEPVVAPKPKQKAQPKKKTSPKQKAKKAPAKK